MTQNHRWAVIGAGRFALEQMAPAIHMARGADLVAIGTSDPAKATPFQAFAGDLFVGSYEEVFNRSDIDAVYIATPNSTHTPLAIQALEAGKAVLCEKPVSMTVSELDELIAARDRTGLPAAEAYMVLHHPQWHRAKALVQEGALGEVLFVESVFSFGLPLDSGNIRLDSQVGGGALRDIGVYPMGVARYVMGAELEDVQAKGTLHNGIDLATTISATLGTAAFSAHLDMRLSEYQHITFHGRDGALRLTAPFNAGVHAEAILTLSRGATEVVERFPTVNHYVLQVEAFGAYLKGAPCPVPLEFSRGTQTVIDDIIAGFT